MTLIGYQPYFDMKILRLVEESCSSIRLSNAIRIAKLLPIETVGEYLNAGDDAKKRFMILQNLGRKSANELDKLIQNFVRQSRRLQPTTEFMAPVTAAPPLPVVRERLIELFRFDLFPDVFLSSGIKKRLQTCLLEESSRPLSEVLSTWQSSCAALLGRQNIGRKSIVDLSALALGHIRKRLHEFGFTVDEITAAIPVVLMGELPNAEVSKTLKARLDGLKACPPSNDEPGPDTLVDVVSWALALLDERERDVLMRRYGHPDQESETLEAISLTYNLTRERIRQIESKALQKLSVRNIKRRFDTAFSSEKEFLSTRLHRGESYLSNDMVSRAFQSLPASDRIAADLLYKDRESLLVEIAVRWGDGWIFPPLALDMLNYVSEQLHTKSKFIPFPNSLEEIAESLPFEYVMATLNLTMNLSTFEGYVAKKSFGARLKRTIRLHRKLCESKCPLETKELVARYHKSFPNDLCSIRDTIIVMCAAPHLFVELQDGIWAAIGDTSQQQVSQSDESAGTVEDLVRDLNEPSAQTIRAGLRSILSQRGPLRFVDLRSEAIDLLGQNHTHSIGPILLTSGTFVRPLPGVYALENQLPELRSITFNPPAFLLNEEQTRWLAMARYAGEPFGSFSMWQPEAEYALCRWGEHNADPILWQSLLKVSSIDLWPVSDRERGHWHNLKVRRGIYGLTAPMRYPIRQLWPPLPRLLAAMYVVQVRDGLNWIVINRILKRRIDAHTAPALLGILCLLGIISPPAHWQMFHGKCEDPHQLIDALSHELRRTGSLTWESDIGRKLIAKLSAHTDLPQDAWLNADLIRELRAVAEVGLVDSLPVDADDDAVSFEKLLEEVARQKRLEAIREDVSDAVDDDGKN